MTDSFDDAARALFYTKWGFSQATRWETGEDKHIDDLSRALRDNWNTALDAAADAVRTNTLLSGSIGPLMDMGWNAANKAGADAVLKLKVGI